MSQTCTQFSSWTSDVDANWYDGFACLSRVGNLSSATQLIAIGTHTLSSRKRGGRRAMVVKMAWGPVKPETISLEPEFVNLTGSGLINLSTIDCNRIWSTSKKTMEVRNRIGDVTYHLVMRKRFQKDIILVLDELKLCVWVR